MNLFFFFLSSQSVKEDSCWKLHTFGRVNKWHHATVATPHNPPLPSYIIHSTVPGADLEPHHLTIAPPPPAPGERISAKSQEDCQFYWLYAFKEVQEPSWFLCKLWPSGTRLHRACNRDRGCEGIHRSVCRPCRDITCHHRFTDPFPWPFIITHWEFTNRFALAHPAR